MRSEYKYPFIDIEFKNKSSKITIICNKCNNIFKQSYID